MFDGRGRIPATPERCCECPTPPPPPNSPPVSDSILNCGWVRRLPLFIAPTGRLARGGPLPNLGAIGRLPSCVSRNQQHHDVDALGRLFSINRAPIRILRRGPKLRDASRPRSRPNPIDGFGGGGPFLVYQLLRSAPCVELDTQRARTYRIARQGSSDPENAFYVHRAPGLCGGGVGVRRGWVGGFWLFKTASRTSRRRESINGPCSEDIFFAPLTRRRKSPYYAGKFWSALVTSFWAPLYTRRRKYLRGLDGRKGAPARPAPARPSPIRAYPHRWARALDYCRSTLALLLDARRS